ncbi:copper resistance CopC family protein [Pseudofrankia sp. DC12]|uniref:copper resistance CopC family protein n=1 Tax=Pseudofrankia sp. DC12 TaxID=683315 RepID=UPI000698E468|nr:copper resistance CopC family protein [Pseudofrankia sp. DC12]
MRALTRLVGLTVASLVLLVATAATASAHATLLFTSPAADGTVPAGPATLTLIFAQPVTVTGHSVRLFDADRRVVSTSRTSVSEGGLSVTAAVDRQLASGLYAVAWQVGAGDGEAMGGEYRFAVGPSAAALGDGQTGAKTRGEGWVTVLRWLLFAGLALYLGGLAGHRLARRPQDRAAADPPRPWLLAGALAGLVASLGLATLIVGDSSLSAGVARLTPAALLATRPGTVGTVPVRRPVPGQQPLRRWRGPGHHPPRHHRRPEPAGAGLPRRGPPDRAHPDSRREDRPRGARRPQPSDHPQLRLPGPDEP